MLVITKAMIDCCEIILNRCACLIDLEHRILASLKRVG